MNDKICIVTGANSGIGKETAAALAEQGATVAIVCRDRAKGERAVADVVRRSKNDRVSLFVADLSSHASVREVAAEPDAALPRVDVLVNNAGLIMGERVLTVDGIETTFAVNHLAYFLLTRLLEAKLRASAPARVVSVASDAHQSGTIDFDDIGGERGYSGWKAYSQSKLANVLFTYELARRLDGSGVTANCLHPGVVGTNFANAGPWFVRAAFTLAKPFLVSPAKGAQTSIYLASSPEVEGVTGKYFANRREARSNRESHDPQIAARLWSLSEGMTGLAST
jgi:NAD(P)-dependent dehydrogenase (short-subunit alcohol dehydrogenase family)